MNGYPNAPAVAKAALIATGGAIPVPRPVVLQYNPEQLTRGIDPAYENVGDNPTGTGLIAAPPKETLSLTARVSAVDQLQASDPTAMRFGIHPQLCLLESMLYPSLLTVTADLAEMALGVIEVVPPDLPLTILVWGTNRVVPVQITRYSVVETMHDTALNPIDAEVSIDLQVLTYRNFSLGQPGFGLYLASLAQREAMSVMGVVQGAAGNVAGVLTR